MNQYIELHCTHCTHCTHCRFLDQDLQSYFSLITICRYIHLTPVFPPTCTKYSQEGAAVLTTMPINRPLCPGCIAKAKGGNCRHKSIQSRSFAARSNDEARLSAVQLKVFETHLDSPVSRLRRAASGFGQYTHFNMLKRWLVVELALAGLGVSTGHRTIGDSIDCEVSEWAYSACEGGRQLRTRYVVRAPSARGRQCPQLLDETIFCLPVHCDVSDWSAYSPCDATGHRTRTREVTVEPAFGGRACPHLDDRRLCDASECRVSDWSAWTCDPSDGVQSRVRRVLNPRYELDASSCPPLIETKPCDPQDCVLGDAFAPVGPCDPSLGTQTFRLQVLQEPRYGGHACAQREEVRACASNGRKVDCVCKWSAWTACWTDGFQYRARWVMVEPERGGKPCPPLDKRKQRRPCVASFNATQ